MAVLRLAQEIDRAVEYVFGVVIHGGDFATWNPTITASRQLTPDPIGEGTRFEWKLRGFGNVEQELQEFDPNRRARIVPHHRSIAGGHRSPSRTSVAERGSITSSRWSRRASSRSCRRS